MPMGSELEPWYPWAGAAVWSRGKRCLPDQLYLCATTEGQTLTVCSGQEKTKHGPWKCDVLQWEPLQRNLCKGTSSHQFCCLFCSVTAADFSAKKNFLVHFISMKRGVGTPAEVGGGVYGGTLCCRCPCPQLRQGKQHSSERLFFETFLCRSWSTEETILSRAIRALLLHQPLIFSLLPLPAVIVFPLCSDSKLELGVRGTN